MKAFLHIGTEKTGTTTIQSFLAKNRQSLLDKDYLYPESPGKTNHFGLAIFSSNSNRCASIYQFLQLDTLEKVIQFKTKFPHILAQELTLSNCNKVIFSSEHCSSRLIDEQDIERLKNVLDTFFDDIEVIIYLRRQDKFLASSYSTAVRSGRTEKFKIPSKTTIEIRYNYYNILNKFANVFGKNKITVRIFESSQMIEGDLIQDFMNIIGLKMDNSYLSVSNLNTSLDVYSLEYIRLLNKNLKKIIKDNPDKYIKKIIKRLETYSYQYQNKQSLLLSEKMAREFMSLFEESNQKVANLYLNRADGKLFNNDFSRLPQQDISPITMNLKLLEITAFLLKDKLIRRS
ncbi:hypothetical protein cce_1335 [Crocosphaera subtropica ATCC 51142]|uniref:Sulfotransferase domain-containing protein n=1 Tax=Crocosphaera subtropica (strain ATCC 51142 / BH68) TaxID=43989 RepID=B1WVU8_CROS5|nr:hypothetical protein [Crocosphaera subtropica]ACB50685.1 hypothetical protein cce_1335 [Crocosphaera subtropica ATCC 51142]